MNTETICILGGSFNPVHLGHLQMARSAQAQCMADQVWFLPAGKPWQKESNTLAPALERLHMVELAIQGVHSWRVERFEIEQNTPNYTVNTLEALSEKYPAYKFCFVIGADQLANLTSWKYWQSLFDYVRIGVVDRTLWGDFKVPEPLKKHLMQDRLFRIPMSSVGVSSTLIRHQFTLLDSPNAEIRETARFKLEAALPAAVFKYLMSKPVYGRLAP